MFSKFYIKLSDVITQRLLKKRTLRYLLLSLVASPVFCKDLWEFSSTFNDYTATNI